jgi:hypothetical protein
MVGGVDDEHVPAWRDFAERGIVVKQAYVDHAIEPTD